MMSLVMKNNRKTSTQPNIFGHNLFFSTLTPIFYLIFRFLDKFYITYLFFKKNVWFKNRTKRSKNTFTTFFNIKDTRLPFSYNFLLNTMTPIFYYRFGFSERFYLIHPIFINIVWLHFTQLNIKHSCCCGVSVVLHFRPYNVTNHPFVNFIFDILILNTFTFSTYVIL